MATTVRRKTVFNPSQAFREHITLKREGNAIVARSNKLKDSLKAWFKDAQRDTAEVYENENGSLFYDFPDPISDGKDTYSGMELRRSVSTIFVEDEAEKILKRKGVYEEALTPVIDQDKIYRLVQEGKITEKDLDKMFAEKESFAFWPVKEA